MRFVSRLKPSLLLPVVFGIVAVVLLSAVASAGWRVPIEHDRYFGYAASLALGHGYRGCPMNVDMICETPEKTAYRLPGYPALLGTVYWLTSSADYIFKARLLSVVLSTLLVVITVRFAQRLAGIWGALIAGLVLLSNELLYYYGVQALTEAQFALEIILLAYGLTFWHDERPRLLGLLVGVTVLTRGSLTLTIPLLFLLVARRHWLRFGIGIAIPVALWTLRNWLVMGAPILLSTGSGAVLWGANNPYTWSFEAGSWLNFARDPAALARYGNLREIDLDRILTADALTFIRAQPVGTILAVTWVKIRQLWTVAAGPYVLLVILGAIYASTLLIRYRRTVFRIAAQYRHLLRL